MLISDGRFSQQLADECPDIDVIIRKPSVSILKAAVKFLKSEKPASILIEGDRISKNDFDKLTGELRACSMTTSSGVVESLREVKDRDEVNLIGRAIEIAEKSFLGLRRLLGGKASDQTQDGTGPVPACQPTRLMSEKQVADALEAQLRHYGAVSSSFPTIVGVGPRAALPHGTPSDRLLGDSPFVLIDWGAREGQYVSDLTRVLITGALPSKIDRIYHTVLAAQEAAIRAIQPGTLLSQIDHSARSVIASAGFGKSFTHGLGHGFGLQVHESIRMSKGQDRPLKVGMVVTVEPGIYLPGIGGVRIEDDVIVTRGGCRLLSTLPRDLESNRQSLT